MRRRVSAGDPAPLVLSDKLLEMDVPADRTPAMATEVTSRWWSVVELLLLPLSRTERGVVSTCLEEKQTLLRTDSRTLQGVR